MAENKTSFVLYCDIMHTVKKLSNEQAGVLFKHILSYVNDENPVTDDFIIELTFEPIKQQLKRSLIKWEETKTHRSESGRSGGIKSGESRRIKKEQNEANEANASNTKQTNQNEANEAVPVSVSVSVSVPVNENNNNTLSDPPAKKERENFIKPTVLEITAYCISRNSPINPDEFFDWNESKGWMVGKDKMKDWKAALRTWENKRKADQSETPDKLGYNESYINGKRMFNRCIEIPKGTPPCPNNLHHWSELKKAFVFGN